jgi:hypothetical protein
MVGSLVLGEAGEPQGRKIAGVGGRRTVRVGALVAGWRRMFKVVREMLEVPHTFPPPPSRPRAAGFRAWGFGTGFA